MADTRPRAARGATVRALATILLMTWLAAAFQVGTRAVHEARSRTVALVADLTALRMLAAGAALDEALIRLRDAGVNALAVRDITPALLRQTGAAWVFSGEEVLAAARESGRLHPLLRRPASEGSIVPERTYVLADDGPVAAWLRDRVCPELGPRHCRLSEDRDAVLLELAIPPADWARFGLGLLPADLELAAKHGLGVVPVLADVPGDDPAAVRRALDARLPDGGAAAVVLAGPVAPGHGRGLSGTASWVCDRGLVVALLDGAPPGSPSLLREAGWRAVRGVDLRVAGDPETAALQLARRALAGNVRLILVRPPATGAPGARLETLAATVRAVRERLVESGVATGAPRPYGLTVGMGGRLAAHVGLASAAALLLGRLVRLPALLGPALAAALVGAGEVGVLAGLGDAVHAACVLSAAALATAWAVDALARRQASRRLPAGAPGPWRRLAAGIGDAVAGLGVTFAGGVFVAALLADAARWLEASAPTSHPSPWLAGLIAGLAVLCWRLLAGWPEQGSLRAQRPGDALRSAAGVLNRARRELVRGHLPWRALASAAAVWAGGAAVAGLSRAGMGSLPAWLEPAPALAAALAAPGAALAGGWAGEFLRPAGAAVSVLAWAGTAAFVAVPGVDLLAPVLTALVGLGAGVALLCAATGVWAAAAAVRGAVARVWPRRPPIRAVGSGGP